MQNQSTVSILRSRLRIFVETLSGKSIILEVDMFQTISDVKKEIESTNEGIWSHLYNLTSGAMELEDGQTLAAYNIQNQAILRSKARSVSSFLLPARFQVVFPIFVTTPTGKTITLVARSSDSVYSVKNVIKIREGVPHNRQKLIFAGDQLQDGFTISECGINALSSMLHLVIVRKPRIFVATPYGKRISLDADASITVKQIKDMIESKENILPDHQHLLCDTIQLEDERTLAENDVRNESTLRLVLKVPLETMRIFFNLLSGRTICILEAERSDTILRVQLRVEERIRIPSPFGLRLALLNSLRTYLDYRRTLGYYNVRNNSTFLIILSCQPKELDRIFVKTPTGKMIHLDLKKFDTVYDIKKQIEDREGIPLRIQQFMFSGIKLENQFTLRHYDIPEEPTLRLCLLYGRPMLLFVEFIDMSETITLEVNSSDTVRRVKVKIQGKVPFLRPNHQRLMRFERELRDGITLAEYHLPMETTLQLYRRVSWRRLTSCRRCPHTAA